jgi:hypothetical protein
VLQEYENKELAKRNSLNNHSPPYFDAAMANGPGCNITVLLLYNRIRPSPWKCLKDFPDTGAMN